MLANDIQVHSRRDAAKGTYAGLLAELGKDEAEIMAAIASMMEEEA